MNGATRNTRQIPILRHAMPMLILAYGLWVVWQAAARGVLSRGALGEYSLFSYVLLVGLVSSGLVFLRAQTWSINGPFLLLFLAYGHVLSKMRPIAHVPMELEWAFDFIGYTTTCAVIAAGMILEQGRRQVKSD